MQKGFSNGTAKIKRLDDLYAGLKKYNLCFSTEQIASNVRYAGIPTFCGFFVGSHNPADRFAASDILSEYGIQHELIGDKYIKIKPESVEIATKLFGENLETYRYTGKINNLSALEQALQTAISNKR